MKEDLSKSIEKYKVDHPEFNEIMKKFQMAQEAYDKALASIGMKLQRTGSTYTLTTGGSYNANVSKSN